MVCEKRDCNLQSITITFSSVHCDNDVTAASASVLCSAQSQNKKRKIESCVCDNDVSFNRMEIPVFCRISIHSPADQLLPHLLASLRESPTGDLDPLRSAINLRILYGNEKRFKKMFRLSRNVFNTVLDVLSPFLNDGMSRNHEQNVLAST